MQHAGRGTLTCCDAVWHDTASDSGISCQRQPSFSCVPPDALFRSQRSNVKCSIQILLRLGQIARRGVMHGKQQQWEIALCPKPMIMTCSACMAVNFMTYCENNAPYFNGLKTSAYTAWFAGSCLWRLLRVRAGKASCRALRQHHAAEAGRRSEAAGKHSGSFEQAEWCLESRV